MDRPTVKYNNGVKIVELELVPIELAKSNPCSECYVGYECSNNTEKDIPACCKGDRDCLYDGFWKLKK